MKNLPVSQRSTAKALTIALGIMAVSAQANVASAAAECSVYTGSNQSGTSMTKIADCDPGDNFSCSTTSDVHSLQDTVLQNNVHSIRLDADPNADHTSEAFMYLYNWQGTGLLLTLSVRDDQDTNPIESNIVNNSSLISSFKCGTDDEG